MSRSKRIFAECEGSNLCTHEIKGQASPLFHPHAHPPIPPANRHTMDKKKNGGKIADTEIDMEIFVVRSESFDVEWEE